MSTTIPPCSHEAEALAEAAPAPAPAVSRPDTSAVGEPNDGSEQTLDRGGATPTGAKTNLLGASFCELDHLVIDWGEARFRAKQLYEAIYHRRVESFERVTSFPARRRDHISERFTLERPAIDCVEVSTDGTRKYRFVAADGAAFEAVYIPEVAKESCTNTLCISSQTGCSVGCRFCFTASIKRYRNLSTSEILGQVLAVDADVTAAHGERGRVSNVVFMGMGEPLLNYDNVVRAAQRLTEPDGLNFSTRRVTISTSGIVPRIHDLGRALRTQLAVSLNATTDDVRSHIMPINRKWPLAALLAALRVYPLPPRRRITIEYVLLRDINDSVGDARRLVKLLAGIPVKVNLLPLNSHDRTEFVPPTPETVDQFQEVLRHAGINALKRTPRGQDIAAACGRLGESAAPVAQP